jgi:hypothetical protein
MSRKSQNQTDMKYLNTSIWLFLCLLAFQTMEAQVTLAKKDIKCTGENNGKVSVVSITNATFPIKNYAWSNGKSGPDTKTIDHLGAGTYTVTVTDAHNCTGSASMEVKQPSAPLGLDLTSSADEFYLCGVSSIIVVAMPSGGTPPYTTNGSSGAFSKRVSLATFGNGPKYLDFETTDAHGCKKKHRQFFAFSAVSCASDPNDITGPSGIKTSRWVAAKDRIEYNIRFENDPANATAPAQVVKVTMAVDPKVNPFSLQLGDFGWGPYQFSVPDGSTFYQKRLDLTDSLNLLVDVTAGYNINTNEYFWYFESVDPLTGQLPTDPLRGFLPINDSLSGKGEGFIQFTVLPKSNVITGDSVSAKAKIVFDVNDAILTNTWGNKLDAVAPTSTLHEIMDSTYDHNVVLSWSAADDPGGVGVLDYDLLVSVDHGPFVLVEDQITDTNYIYEANPGAEYGFVVLATDSVGNRETMKTHAEDSIYVIPVRSIQLVNPSGHDLCVQDTLTIRWTKITTDTVLLEMSLDSGEMFFTLGPALTADSFKLFLNSSMIAEHVFLRLTDVRDTSVHILSQPLSIHELPVVDAGPNTGVCNGDYLILAANGANTFVWDSAVTLNFLDVYNPRATPVATTKYYVEGTDVFGCRDRDSVTLTLLPVYLDSVIHYMCNEDSVFLEGAYQTQPGYYTDDLAAATGCDSTVVTQVILTGPCPFPSPYVYVDKDAVGLNNGTSWANAFNDLQDALDAVDYYNNIREVWIAEGEYHPSSSVDRNASYVLRDSVTIYGGFLGTESERSERVLDPSLVRLSGDLGILNDSTDNAYHVVKVDSLCGDCILDGLTISFGDANGVPADATIGAGLLVKGKILLNNLVIERNTTTMDGAAIYNSGANAILTIQGCLFRLNTSGLQRDILNSNGAQIQFQGLNTIQD